MAGSEPRLTIELVPATCLKNLRNVLPRKQWDTLRRRTYREAGGRCEICGGQGSRHPVECHEVWEYDDRHHVQRLLRLVALCPACHAVKHMGFSGTIGRLDEALAHLVAVNSWPAERAVAYTKAAFAQRLERSQHDWVLDLDALRDYGLDPDSVEPKPGARRASRASEGVAKIESRRSRRQVAVSGPDIHDYWTCDGCGRRAKAVLVRVDPADLPPGLESFLADKGFSPDVRATTEVKPPSGWTRRGARVLCDSCGEVAG